jgi:type II secretory pathway component PulM
VGGEVAPPPEMDEVGSLEQEVAELRAQVAALEGKLERERAARAEAEQKVVGPSRKSR